MIYLFLLLSSPFFFPFLGQARLVAYWPKVCPRATISDRASEIAMGRDELESWDNAFRILYSTGSSAPLPLIFPHHCTRTHL